MKILTVIGARPQFVKAAAFRHMCREIGINEVLLHTGQHYDPNLSIDIFDELEIPRPEISISIENRKHALMTGELIFKISEQLESNKPDFVNVFGDTTSTLAGALSANKLGIPVMHIEAGLRSFNKNMPEEVNRILTDNISDFLFCPTESAVNNLKAENISSQIFNVGDIMYDAVKLFRAKFKMPKNIKLSSNKKIAVFTCHRHEALNSADYLQQIIDFCLNFENEYQIIFPIHPHTLKKIDLYEISLSGINVIPPVSYLEMQGLLAQADLLLTDSGGLQKEAYFHGVDCITLRDETEWPETIDSGWNRLWRKLDNMCVKKPITEYGDGDTAKKIIDIMQEFC